MASAQSSAQSQARMSGDRAAASPTPAPRSIGGIGALAAEISAACFDRPEAKAERIKAALRRAAAEPRILSAEQRLPMVDRYARHVIYSDPAGRFTVLAIVWGPGQFSPPHAHHTWCAYAVHDGTLEETVFRWDDATSKAEPVRTEAREPGYSCYAGAGLDQIHRLGNSGTRPAVSIHVYGVDRENVACGVNRMVETD
jgi:predicted metal-dependent enzyme (double-stranded beta helix superfamily)